jgi:ribosomal-protein-alanine N-acetyltransferase
MPPPRETVVVRPAEERDLRQVHAIEVASFADPWALEGFRDTMDNSRARTEVADDGGGRVLGYAVAWFVADEAEIANLAVAPAARGRGIGALLLTRILQAAATFGAAAVYLEVRESNAAARALYAAQGFVVAGRRNQYYRKPVEDALIMRRNL